MAEPFITLSSGHTTDESASDSFDNSTPLSTPLSTTHDTSRASFHIKDLEDFAKDLQNAADRAFPNQGRAQNRYKNASVFLLSWQDDEMAVGWELHDLKNVFTKYGFNTETWPIPTKNSHLKLMSKAIEIVEQNNDEENLVIIYYAGHALINNARQATWSCKADVGYASLEWSAIQTLFEKANFDVLLLLDCCAAASAAPTVGCAVTETIAACGFENSAPQPGRHSFTNTLIEVLEDWIDSPPFSAAMLHNKVLSILKHERPERAQSGKRRKVECRRTPIHIMGTADPRIPSIELGRRLPSRDNLSSGNAISSPTQAGPSAPSSACQWPENSSKHNGYHLNDLNDANGEYFDVPRVIISLSLEEYQMLNSKTCAKWLESCPALVKCAKVEAVYNSFSTLMLLSIPVFVWNLLPEDPACSFVGYVTSTNLVGPVLASSKADVLQPQSTARLTTTNLEKHSAIIENKRREKKTWPKYLPKASGKDLLPKALQKANEAVVLDNAQDFEGAMQGYQEARDFLEQAMPLYIGAEDKGKLEAICYTYMTRINELGRKENLHRPLLPQPEEAQLGLGTKAVNSQSASPKATFSKSQRSKVPPVPDGSAKVANRFPLQAEHDLEKIVDTCFSRPESPSNNPQDWVFNFDTPVPHPDSKERRLNVNPPRRGIVSKTGETTFFGTIGSDDFAPSGMDQKSGPISGSRDSVLDPPPTHPEPNTGSSDSPPPYLAQREAMPQPAADTSKEADIQHGDKPSDEAAGVRPRHQEGAASSQKRNYSPTITKPDKVAVKAKGAKKTKFDGVWSYISDPEERRRIQNRVTQRKYRDSIKERKESADPFKRVVQGLRNKDAGSVLSGRQLEENEVHELTAPEPVGSELNTPRDGHMDPIEEWPLPLTPLPLLFAMTELRDERLNNYASGIHEINPAYKAGAAKNGNRRVH